MSICQKCGWRVKRKGNRKQHTKGSWIHKKCPVITWKDIKKRAEKFKKERGEECRTLKDFIDWVDGKVKINGVPIKKDK